MYDRLWHLSASRRPVHEWPLSGVELPLDAGSAAIPSGTAALGALLDRRVLTPSRTRSVDENSLRLPVERACELQGALAVLGTGPGCWAVGCVEL